MTTTMIRPVELWSTMPGWGITADLTPPELINSRQLKLLRKVLAAGLVALLVLCLGGYLLAARKHSSASSTLSSVQVRTTQLQSDTRTFAKITKIQTTLTQVRFKIAKLMSGDVDVAKLMGQIRSSLPTTMTISHESVTVSLAGVASAGAPGSGSGSAGGLDTSGRSHIGNITIFGAGRTLDDLSAYVDRLKVIPGVIDVVPTSNVRDKTGMQYSVSLSLTDVLFTHRFDVTDGGK